MGRIFCVIVSLPFFPSYLNAEYSTIKKLFIASCIRFCFVPVFFVLSNESSRSSDIPIIALCSFLAFSSGFIVTSSFQYAQNSLKPEEKDLNISKQASLLNIAFALSAVFGILGSFTLSLFHH